MHNSSPPLTRLLIQLLLFSVTLLAGQPLLAEDNSSSATDNSLKLVKVPAGCFQMGDPDGDVGFDARPVHRVCLDSFMIGRYEVTQGQWQTVMGDNPSRFKRGKDFPVEQVSWDDVQEFITRLNRKSGQTYRLPSEAEWEYACRAGTDKEPYCGGTEVDELAWYRENSDGATHQIGKKKANALGIHDMSGNVQEWTGDFYQNNYYKESPERNPGGPSTGRKRVYRGGSWHDFICCSLQAERNKFPPNFRANTIGFRLVLAGP